MYVCRDDLISCCIISVIAVCEIPRDNMTITARTARAAVVSDIHTTVRVRVIKTVVGFNEEKRETTLRRKPKCE